MRKSSKSFSAMAVTRATAAMLVISTGSSEFGVAKAAGASSPDIIGYWLTDTRDSIVQIGNCGARNICGMIRSYKGTGKETDKGNPDKAKRAKPICNLQIIGNLAPTAKGWTSGWIYDPESGEKYQLSISLSGPNKAKLRAYEGVETLGETFVWTRSAKIPSGCQDV